MMTTESRKAAAEHVRSSFIGDSRAHQVDIRLKNRSSPLLLHEQPTIPQVSIIRLVTLAAMRSRRFYRPAGNSVNPASCEREHDGGVGAAKML